MPGGRVNLRDGARRFAVAPVAGRIPPAGRGAFPAVARRNENGVPMACRSSFRADFRIFEQFNKHISMMCLSMRLKIANRCRYSSKTRLARHLRALSVNGSPRVRQPALARWDGHGPRLPCTKTKRAPDGAFLRGSGAGNRIARAASARFLGERPPTWTLPRPLRHRRRRSSSRRRSSRGSCRSCACVVP